MERQLLSVREFADTCGIGETLAKQLIREGHVTSVRLGDRRLIPAGVVREFVARLVQEAASARSAQPHRIQR